MSTGEWQVKIESSPFKLGFDIFIFYRNNQGDHFIINGDEEVKVEKGLAAKSTLFLFPEMLQALADELQRINIKPKEVGKSEGLLEAQTYHLEDLRTLLKLDTKIINLEKKQNEI